MAHFAGIHYTLAFAQAFINRLREGDFDVDALAHRFRKIRCVFFYMSLIVSHVNESWIDVHMSISAHAYMHMVCMHTWCSKMFSSTNGTFCWLCQAEYISGGKCLNPEHVSTLVVFVKMELCKSALFMCFLSFQWHFSVSVVMFFIVLYFSSAKLAFLFF